MRIAEHLDHRVDSMSNVTQFGSYRKKPVSHSVDHTEERNKQGIPKIKVAHFSDLHYCPKHLEQVDKCFGFAIDHAIHNGAQVAVISGDSFDSTMGIHEPAYAAYLSRIIQLADRMPILVLQGTFSHDRAGSLDPLKILKARFPILVADEPGQYSLVRFSAQSVVAEWIRLPLGHIPTLRDQADESEGSQCANAIFSVLPSLNKADPEVMGRSGGPRQYAADLLVSWWPLNQLAREAGIPTILVTHGTVGGCKTESGYSLVSPDHEFDVDALFDSGPQAIMLGHIHAHQSWAETDEDKVRMAAYAGSIARLAHGRYRPVGYLLWEVGGDSADFYLIPTPADELLDLFYEGMPDVEEIRSIDVTGQHVRLRYTVGQDNCSAVDKDELRRILTKAGAASIRIEPTVVPIQSVRSPGIGSAQTLPQKLERWVRDANAADLTDRIPALMEALSLVKSMDVDEALASIIRNTQEDAA